MKQITKKIGLFIIAALISNTALHAAVIRDAAIRSVQGVDWHRATTAQKIELLKQYTEKEFETLRLTTPIFDTENTPSPHQLISLIEGKEIYHQRGIVPLIEKISSSFPSSTLLLKALNNCQDASIRIAEVMNFYRQNINKNLSNNQKKQLTKAVTSRIDALKAKNLPKLDADFIALDREKFYLSADKEAARIFLYFFNSYLIHAIKKIDTKWKNKQRELNVEPERRDAEEEKEIKEKAAGAKQEQKAREIRKAKPEIKKEVRVAEPIRPVESPAEIRQRKLDKLDKS